MKILNIKVKSMIYFFLVQQYPYAGLQLMQVNNYVLWEVITGKQECKQYSTFIK